MGKPGHLAVLEGHALLLPGPLSPFPMSHRQQCGAWKQLQRALQRWCFPWDSLLSPEPQSHRLIEKVQRS